MVDLQDLQAPFSLEEHQWRAQGLSRDGRRAQALCYINARSVQTRLDAVCGVAGWESRFTETPSGRVIATISIDMGSRWIAKSDGAGSTAMEGEKGGISDAFKRAAVMWGIGRYLYSLPATWAECEPVADQHGQPRLRNGKMSWKRWTLKGERLLDEMLRNAISAHGGVQTARVIDQAPALLPSPATMAADLDAIAKDDRAHWPCEVTGLLLGLPDAVRNGTHLDLWKDLWPQVPVEWRRFVVAEKDRIVSELSPVRGRR